MFFSCQGLGSSWQVQYHQLCIMRLFHYHLGGEDDDDDDDDDDKVLVHMSIIRSKGIRKEEKKEEQ